MWRGSSLDIVQDIERAGVLLSPLRLQIVRELREPDSAAGLSRRLGLARQKLNYHLRELEAWGFVELVEERKKRNCIERVLRASARSYVLDPGALGELSADPESFTERFSSAYLVALAAKVIHDVAALRDRAGKATKKVPTLTLHSELRFASAEKQKAFAEELAAEVARLVAKYHDEQAPGGRRFNLLLASYPKIDKETKP